MHTLSNIVTSYGWIYVYIVKSVYRLKQAACIAYDLLKTRIVQHGYTPYLDNVNYWKHSIRQTKILLCMDGIGIKYYYKEETNHLLDTLNNITK